MKFRENGDRLGQRHVKKHDLRLFRCMNIWYLPIRIYQILCWLGMK